MSALRAPIAGDGALILELLRGDADASDLSIRPENARVWPDEAGIGVYANLSVLEQGRLVWLDLRARPELRGSAAERAAIAWAVEHASSLCASGARIRCVVSSEHNARKHALAEAGFEPTAYSFTLEIDLPATPSSPAEPPDDMVIRPFSPGEERGVYDVHAESFADALDRIEMTYEEWLEDRVEHPSFDPSLWLVAHDGTELAGIVLSRMRGERGWIGILGVRPPWRRRGLGAALLCAAFAEFARRSVETVALSVDAASPTGALRLYERAGMHVVERLDTYERVLS